MVGIVGLLCPPDSDQESSLGSFECSLSCCPWTFIHFLTMSSQAEHIGQMSVMVTNSFGSFWKFYCKGRLTPAVSYQHLLVVAPWWVELLLWVFGFPQKGVRLVENGHFVIKFSFDRLGLNMVSLYKSPGKLLKAVNSSAQSDLDSSIVAMFWASLLTM